MQPVYLPFTHISSHVADRIHDILGPFSIYQPGGVSTPSQLKDLAVKDIIKIRNPIEPAEDDILASLIRDYHAWADLQRGRSKIDTRAFLAALDPIPFFGENSSAQIRKEIKQLGRGESLQPKQDLILTARLFLALAQEYDIRKMDLVKDLDAVAVMENDLVNRLLGDEDAKLNTLQTKPVLIEDVGAYMTKQRIEAWSTLFRADTCLMDIFVTDSRVVIDQICDISDDLIVATTCQDLEIEKKAAEQQVSDYYSNLREKLKQLAYSPDPLALVQQWSQKKSSSDELSDDSCQWSVYLAPGVSPDIFWQRYKDRIAGKKNSLPKSADVLNTLVFYLEL